MREVNLSEQFYWEKVRQLNNDWTIQYEGSSYQIAKSRSIRPKQKLQVRRYLTGELRFYKGQQQLSATKLKAYRQAKPKRLKQSLSRSKIGRLNSQNSPWRQYNRKWLRA